MSRTFRSLTGSALVALLVGPAIAAAQNGPVLTTPDSAHWKGPVTADGEPRLQGGLTFSAGQPLGAFHDNVKDGLGVGAHALYRLDDRGAFAMRLDGGWINYGRESLALPLSDRPGGGRVQLDVTTTNNIFWLGIGPQLMVPSGPVRPYVNATAGFSYFATLSSVKGRGNSDSFANDTNFDDTRFSWGGGTGVLVPVHSGNRSLVFLDIGARYHDNGRNVRYLREGGIRDLPDGRIQFDPIRGRADLITWHVGVSVGVR